jgi:hypothetical protein
MRILGVGVRLVDDPLDPVALEHLEENITLVAWSA